MKRIGKIPFLVVSLLFIVCSVFAVLSFAKEENKAISIVGAERTHRDFTGDAYEVHVNEDGGVAANPGVKMGDIGLFESVSKKYGHLRTVTTPDGNTVLDLTFHEDYTGKNRGMNDAVVSAVEAKRPLTDISYFVVEFDMTTRTQYPGDIGILMETRVFSSDGRIEIDKDYSACSLMGRYNAAQGSWTFGANRFSFEENVWVHITIVAQLSAVISTTDGIDTVNYSSSQANVYVNGEYATTVYPFADAELDPSYVPAIYYAGVGYEYGKAHVGQKAGDSICIDNCTYTTFDGEYGADADNDRLAALFTDTNPRLCVSDLGEEILYTSDYAFAGPVGLASYQTENEKELLFADLNAALQTLKDEGSITATVKLYANQYRKVVIDSPVTVALNGFELQNGWEVNPALAVEFDSEKGILRVYEDAARQAVFHYYNVPYGSAEEAPVVTEQYALGREISVSDFEQIRPIVVVNGREGLAPTDDFVIYDTQGVQVNIGTVREENLGKTYRVYPVYERTTLASSITFYTVIEDEITFYSERDLWAAANPRHSEVITDDDQMRVTVSYPRAMPDHAKIVLVSDCTISEPLYTLGGNLTVDLGGHTLSSVSAFASTGAQTVTTTLTKANNASSDETVYFIRDMQIFVYSSKPGAELTAGNSDLIFADFDIGSLNGVDYFFGFQSESQKSPENITVSFGARLVYVQKGALDTVHFANATIRSTGTDGEGWIVNAQSRGHQFYFEGCEIFLENHLAASAIGAAVKEIYFKNSSIYGNGKNNVSHLADHKAYTPEMASSSTAYGIMTVSLENSKIYNMNFGQASLEGYYKADTGATPFLRTAATKIVMDLTSMISCEPLNISNDIEGKRLLAKPQAKTIDGTRYMTVYAWVDEEVRSATFNIYDVSFDKLSAESVPLATQQVAIGHWFATFLPLDAEVFYDPDKDAANLIAPKGYVVYDAKGNRVSKEALTESDADAVFTVCIDYDKLPIAFNVKYADGTWDAFSQNNIGAALGITALADVSYCYLPEGATLTLFADCTTSGILVGRNSYIDLSGYTLYAERKLTSFSAAEDKMLFVYSSRAGARICQTPTSESGSAFVVEAKENGSKVYIGYKNAENKSEHGIEIFCGAFAELRGAGAELYLAKINLCANGRDNYGLFNIRAGTDTERAIFLEDCQVYSNRGGFFTIREDSASGKLTMKNTNVYATATASFFSWYARRQTAITASIYMENCGLWGPITLGGLENGLGVATLYVSEECALPQVNKNVVVTDAGKSLVSTLPTVTIDGIKAPASGIYGNTESTVFSGAFAATYTLGVSDDFESDVYVNISLDTNIVINFYVPAIREIQAVMLGEVNLLNTQSTRIIDGKAYYVISLEAPPKQGDKVFHLNIQMRDKASHSFTLSVARYAEALLSMDATGSAYIANSQELMKYILNYIKEVAVKYGDADEALYADLLDGFTVGTVEIAEPVRDLGAIKTYVTHAALDLDAYAGFAFKVAEGFVGTVKLALAGVNSAEYTYTDRNPATANTVILLENVPVHLFRGDVVITVTPVGGEAVEASFNLATYAAVFNESYVKALYAYSQEAQAYNAKYPTAGTVG